MGELRGEIQADVKRILEAGLAGLHNAQKPQNAAILARLDRMAVDALRRSRTPFEAPHAQATPLATGADAEPLSSPHPRSARLPTVKLPADTVPAAPPPLPFEPPPTTIRTSDIPPPPVVVEPPAWVKAG